MNLLESTIVRRYFVIFFICFLPFFSKGQDIKVLAKIDTTKILIGDQINLKLEVHCPSQVKVHFPLIPDSINKIEIINKSKIDTIIDKNKQSIILKQTLRITSFDTGNIYIPAFKFKIVNKGDTSTLITDSLLLAVRIMQVDTTRSIRDIKAPMDIPLTFKEILPYVLSIVGLLLLIFLIIYFYRRYKKRKPLFKFTEKPKIPADLLALQLLEELRKKKLWQENKIKEYYSELTDILREYIESRFNILAKESTTEEIIKMLQEKELDFSAKEILNDILVKADLVKFAKMIPIAAENDLSLSNAIEFINKTRIINTEQTDINVEDNSTNLNRKNV